MRQDKNITKYVDEMAITDRTSVMLICIQGGRSDGCMPDGSGGNMSDGIYGEICSFYLEKPVKFAGVGDMVLKIDEICNWLGTPQRTTDPRFMNREMEQRYHKSTKEHPKMAERQLIDRSGPLPFPQAIKSQEVLIATIKYRQNSSLQGIIRGKLTNGRDISFRSALELIRMMQMIRG